MSLTHEEKSDTVPTELDGAPFERKDSEKIEGVDMNRSRVTLWLALSALILVLLANACPATEILTIPAYGIPLVESSPLLEDGLYIIEVSGTLVFDAHNGRMADAEWLQYDVPEREWIEDSPGGRGTMDLLVDGRASDWLGTADGEGFLPHVFSPTHTYRLYLRGSGGPLTFQIDDPGPAQPWDNSGELTVQITQIPGPSTLVLLSMGAVGLLTYAWRRRRSP